MVVNGVGRVGLGKFQNRREVFSEMSNDGVGDLGNMEESVATMSAVFQVWTEKAYIKSMDQ